MKAEALDWLLDPRDPPVMSQTMTDLLGRPADEVREAREAILSYGPVRRLQAAQRGRGYWLPARTCYEPKFTATVWPLILLGEMGVPRTDWIESAVDRFLAMHQMDNGAFCCSVVGRRGVEEEPCLTGNMIRTLLVFGYGEDGRVKKALDWLPEMQFDDGGWNCDFPRYRPTHSSFMSTIEPLWAYSEVPRQRWTRGMKRSMERGAEFLLGHRVYKSHTDWKTVELRGLSKVFPGNPVTAFHFPMWYYYDVLQGLRVLTKLGYADDRRLQDALHLLMSKKTPEGRWLLEGDWVRERKDTERKNLVNLEELMKPSKWVTLNCYRVLAMTGDLDLP